MWQELNISKRMADVLLVKGGKVLGVGWGLNLELGCTATQRNRTATSKTPPGVEFCNYPPHLQRYHSCDEKWGVCYQSITSY